MDLFGPIISFVWVDLVNRMLNYILSLVQKHLKKQFSTNFEMLVEYGMESVCNRMILIRSKCHAFCSDLFDFLCTQH